MQAVYKLYTSWMQAECMTIVYNMQHDAARCSTIAHKHMHICAYQYVIAPANAPQKPLAIAIFNTVFKFAEKRK